ncbi:MAG: hypothetical protein KY453_01820 [Gemmatimonadetes bacterium]|nr:hypothetical protein [Gemmatimonadota bacterium]
MRAFRLLPVLVLAAAALAPAALGGQEPGTIDAYHRAVGDHFRVSPQEVTVLSDYRLGPDEVPVVLFLAARGGISPDAVVALRRSGRGWADIAGRYGVGGDDFHVSFQSGSPGSLAGVHARFESTPAGSWDGMALSDDEIVGLVNVQVLSEAAGVSPARVQAARDRAGSYAAAFRALLRGD